MTRSEEILNKAIDYSEIEENFLEYDDCGDVCDDKEFIEQAFTEGAKWADRTMLARIREWLKNHDMTEHIGVIYSGACSINFDNQGLIDVLCKAMEE